jgi:dienelactone hydrolase
MKSGLELFQKFSFEFEGVTRDVFRAGSGPGVIAMHEVPGLYPQDIALGRRLVSEGFTVYMPSLIGTPGKAIGPLYGIASMAKVCISKEFFALKTGQASPITVWLRALARHAHGECGGQGVGCIGMCLSGGFALAMMLEPSVIAPVMSQPSLPVPIGANRKRDLGLSPDDLAFIKERVAKGACILGLRFTNDSWVPDERFARLREEFGSGFEALEIDSHRGNQHGFTRFSHSVLAYDLRDKEGNPTRDALLRVIGFLKERLTAA